MIHSNKIIYELVYWQDSDSYYNSVVLSFEKEKLEEIISKVSEYDKQYNSLKSNKEKFEVSEWSQNHPLKIISWFDELIQDHEDYCDIASCLEIISKILL